MKTEITRRKVLQMGCAAVGGTILGKTTSKAETGPAGGAPWAWKPIEPESIQERAYQSAWAKIGCMYGVVESVLGTLADRYSTPYNSFPVAATLYGSGGIGGIGSLCGTVNAGGLLFGIFVPKQDDIFTLCNELSLWYEKTALPVYKPRKPNQDIPIVTSVSGSNLCHVSCTRWSKASGHQLMTMPHFERCNRMVADVAMKIAAMLNRYADGTPIYSEKPDSFSTGCIACHGPGNEKGDVSAGMSCGVCHGNPHPDNGAEPS